MVPPVAASSSSTYLGKELHHGAHIVLRNLNHCLLIGLAGLQDGPTTVVSVRQGGMCKPGHVTARWIVSS
jgi:hypothetical protein